MSVFAEKLDGLLETIQAAKAGVDLQRLSLALRDGSRRVTYAVGSGGSAIAAQYLASCRQTLGATAPTLVQTPLQFALDDAPLAEAEVWLFSAGGSNPDILGAFDAARRRGARQIRLITAAPASSLAEQITAAGGALHLALTADERDGFLATHSLTAAVTVLLLAADHCGPAPRTEPLFLEFVAAARARLGRPQRDAVAALFATVQRDDTLFVLQDPRLDAPALLIETCAWEAGLCPVQRTDFRNFAHGRHVWLAHRGAHSFILALTGRETRHIWADIAAALPGEVRTTARDAGSCGRFETAVALLDGFTVVEALGRATGIDPARPKAGDFAEALYEAPSLRDVSRSLTPGIRVKGSAVRRRDDPAMRDIDLAAAEATFRQTLAHSTFRGLVLDYDGTLVTYEGRFEPMDADLAAELNRLLDDGLMLAVATGRGGSAGEDLRKVLAERHWDGVVVSYYNGGHTQPLRDDLAAQTLPSDPRLDPARVWLKQSRAFKAKPKFRDRPVQISIEIADLADVELITQGFATEANPEGGLRLARSSHTLDICLAEACKTTAAALLAERTQSSLESILCIGDSGAIFGNDHALLGLPRGVSVGRVCDRLETAWSLFGEAVTGPEAVLRILRALEPGIDGHHLRVETLGGLDRA